jgi:hypothetical protein
MVVYFYIGRGWLPELSIPPAQKSVMVNPNYLVAFPLLANYRQAMLLY